MPGVREYPRLPLTLGCLACFVGDGERCGCLLMCDGERRVALCSGLFRLRLPCTNLKVSEHCQHDGCGGGSDRSSQVHSTTVRTAADAPRARAATTRGKR